MSQITLENLINGLQKIASIEVDKGTYIIPLRSESENTNELNEIYEQMIIESNNSAGNQIKPIIYMRVCI